MKIPYFSKHRKIPKNGSFGFISRRICLQSGALRNASIVVPFAGKSLQFTASLETAQPRGKCNALVSFSTCQNSSIGGPPSRPQNGWAQPQRLQKKGAVHAPSCACFGQKGFKAVRTPEPPQKRLHGAISVAESRDLQTWCAGHEPTHGGTNFVNKMTPAEKQVSQPCFLHSYMHAEKAKKKENGVALVRGFVHIVFDNDTKVASSLVPR